MQFEGRSGTLWSLWAQDLTDRPGVKFVPKLTVES